MTIRHLPRLARAAALLLLAAAPLPSRAAEAPARFVEVIAEAGALPRLHALIVARGGEVLMENRFRGPSLDRPVNIKSASKSVLSALVGVGIEKGVLTGLDQTLASVLAGDIPADADPRVRTITVEDLVSMRAGLQSTSGAQYGSWIKSRNWVRDALSRPFEDEPGRNMIYSTASSHLLAAMLTKASGRPLLALAQEWLGAPLGIRVPRWPRDPQGIFRGGNDMELTPHGLLAFGELYRNDGMAGGTRVLPQGWVAASWKQHSVSPHSGYGYGYGWYSRDLRGHEVHYAWGFGGQMVYVVPELDLTVVMISDPSPRGRDEAHVDRLHALLADRIIPAMADEAEPLPRSARLKEEHPGQKREGRQQDQP